MWRWNDVSYRIVRMAPHNTAPELLVYVWVDDDSDTPFTVDWDAFNEGLICNG